MSEEIAVTNTGTVVTDRSIENMIYTVRGIQIIMDQDLAKLYGVDTKRLNEQVKRNKSRFPGDFMFRLTTEEFRILKSQNATSSWGGRRYAPNAFTELGVSMLSSVLDNCSWTYHVIMPNMHQLESSHSIKRTIASLSLTKRYIISVLRSRI